MTSKPLLRVDDIHTYYGSSYILQGMTLEARPGEAVAVLGRNGVGKSTLVKSIIGFTPPRRGVIHYAGQDITAHSTEQISRAGIALVPQGRRTFTSLTVAETLNMASHLKRFDKESVSWSVDSIYQAFPRLAERRDNRAGHLSGGEQQMLAVGRALVGYPRLVLLDEPTEGLSPLLVKELHAVLQLVKERGSTLLLIEQRLTFAMALADRVYLVNKGQVVFAASPDELENAPEIRHTYLGV